MMNVLRYLDAEEVRRSELNWTVAIHGSDRPRSNAMAYGRGMPLVIDERVGGVGNTTRAS